MHVDARARIHAPRAMHAYMHAHMHAKRDKERERKIEREREREREREQREFGIKKYYGRDEPWSLFASQASTYTNMLLSQLLLTLSSALERIRAKRY